jgi:opacity protein-like surface antigen
MFSITKALNRPAKSMLTAVAAAAVLGVVALPAAVQASDSPFTAMSGTWAGTGVITTSDGNKERIRCRAKYDVASAGDTLDLTLRCASDSYNFELQSNATHNNGTVSGNWSENTRHVGGNIEGSARGNVIHVRVSGVISAELGVSTNGNQQSISIQAPGTEMQSVAISMSRGK